MNAVAYARYSTDKQTENSIAYQLSKITEYCNKNKITLTGVYSDEACSGTNTNRTGFQTMLSDARKKKFDAVVIYDISRGSRDVVDWLEFRKDMKMLDIQVISTSQNLGDISDPNAFLTELISVGLGQHQVLDTRKKSIDGTKERAKKGLFCGGYPPIGYDIKDGEYIINETEASAVRKIFSLYADGASYDIIINKLNGLKGKRGQAIGKSSLHAILKNERYIGIYTWNKKQYKYMRKWAGGKPNPNIVKIENAIPPIIDNGTWERVQKRMRTNKRNATNKAKREYLLSGLIKCASCGGAYIGKCSISKKGYETKYYVCGSKYRNHTCNAPNINANELETFVMITVKNYLKELDFNKYAEEILKQLNNTSNDTQKEKAELAEVERKINNCVKSIANGLIFEELQDEVNRLKLRKSELQDIISYNTNSNTEITKGDIINKLNFDVNNIENDPKKVINDLVSVEVNKDGSCTVFVGFLMKSCGSGQYPIRKTINEF